MGLFDLPAPFFGVVDAWLAGLLPEWARLVVWGGIGGTVSMLLYRALSPQAAIRQARAGAAAARTALNAHDGAFAGAGPLIRGMLALSLRQLGLVLGPAVLAALPILFLVAWASTAYGYRFPEPGAEVPIRIAPERFQARWEDGDPAAGGAPRIVVTDEAGDIAGEFTLDAPVPVLHKRQWWNLLIGSPAGYLPDAGAIERIEMGLPPREYIAIGPAWLGGWEAVLFASLLAASLAMKLAFRIA